MCVPYTRINFNKWMILSSLDKKIWRDAELVHTISMEAALLVKRGNLYFVGKWGEYTATSPQVIEKLNFEKVCRIASGTEHAVIVCNKGFVSTFGINNTSGQLGAENLQCVNRDKIFVHIPHVTALIVDICCGDNFTLALDNAGVVWYWGSLFNSATTTPRRFSITNIIKVAADSDRFAALEQSGKVYYSSSGSWNPKEVTSHLAQQIVCCYGCLYILTKEDTLIKHQSRETLVLIGQINYIASNSDQVVARSKNGEYFILDYLNSIFQQTNSTNILECFANTKMPGVYSTGGLEFVSVYEENNMLVENIAQLYNSQQFSDVDIVLSDGTIHAHKCILAARSQLLKRLLTSLESNELNFCNANPNVMKSYISYLYTGRLPDIDNFDHILELYDMIKDDSNKLSDYCFKQGKSLVNEQNALAYYKASANFNITILMKVCAEVVVQNIDKNVVSELIKSLSPEEIHKLFEYGTKGDQ